eukprot:3789912-Amphidinium_carterae.1
MEHMHQKHSWSKRQQWSCAQKCLARWWKPLNAAEKKEAYGVVETNPRQEKKIDAVGSPTLFFRSTLQH